MKWLLLVICGGFSLSAYAEQESAPTLTEQWLKIQRENQQASPHPQTASVETQEKANLRWLKSLEYAIPDQFNSDSNMSSGD